VTATQPLAAFLAPIGMVSRGRNPRRDLGDLTELTESIRQHGVLLPLLVERHHRGGLRLIAGERRYAAAKAAGQQTVPVILRGTRGATHALTLAAIENMHRLEMTPIDEARAIKTMITDGGMTQAQVATELARTPSWVSQRLSLRELPPAVQHKVAAGEIRPTVAAQAVTDLRKTGHAVLGRCTAHLATKHPLWAAARLRCDGAGHPRLGRVNGVCGVCWEATIRADERADTSGTLRGRAEEVA
jgi:ParB/RepB/Spo0J family partition protein